MGEDAHARVRRFTLTGLESPEELWDRLRESTAEVEGLVARNTELDTEVQALRRRLRGAGGLTDEELAAELPRRMTRSLAAAQEVAAELIDQAHNDVMLIRLNADQLASEVVRAAKAEASRIVRGTMAQAQAHLEAAKAQGNEILREAHGQRSRIGAELDERSARMQAEMQRLHEYRQRLEQAYDQVARTLAEGRAALQGAAGPPPPVRATAEPRPPSRAQVAAQEPRAISREEPERAEQAERVGVRPRPDRRRAPVFDRSGAPARVAASDPPPVTKGVTRSVRFASVDAVAG